MLRPICLLWMLLPWPKAPPVTLAPELLYPLQSDGCRQSSYMLLLPRLFTLRDRWLPRCALLCSAQLSCAAASGTLCPECSAAPPYSFAHARVICYILWCFAMRGRLRGSKIAHLNLVFVLRDVRRKLTTAVLRKKLTTAVLRCKWDTLSRVLRCSSVLFCSRKSDLLYFMVLCYERQITRK